jgi:putative PIN family toxin of toxin-antitoxin system
MTVRVVIDTNVVLSALLFESGHVAWLRDAWSRMLCVPLVSTATVEELLRALTYPKFKLSADDREELLGDYLPFAERVELSEAMGLPRCKDPDDQKFLDLALAGRASILITGDNALLALAGSCPFEILSPGQAAAAIRT